MAEPYAADAWKYISLNNKTIRVHGIKFIIHIDMNNRQGSHTNGGMLSAIPQSVFTETLLFTIAVARSVSTPTPSFPQAPPNRATGGLHELCRGQALFSPSVPVPPRAELLYAIAALIRASAVCRRRWHYSIPCGLRVKDGTGAKLIGKRRKYNRMWIDTCRCYISTHSTPASPLYSRSPHSV